MRRRSGNAVAEIILGVLLIISGLVAFINPNGVVSSLVFIYAILAIVMGVLDIVHYARTERYTGFGPVVALIAGIFAVMTGVMMLVYPNAGTVTFYVLFPVWFIAHNIFVLANLNRVRAIAGKFYYYFSMITSIIGLVLGILILVDPFSSFRGISHIIGIYLILTGINCIVLASSRAGLRK